MVEVGVMITLFFIITLVVLLITEGLRMDTRYITEGLRMDTRYITEGLKMDT